MAETPYMLRGYLYPTNRTAKCGAFHQCPLCKLCTNYDKNSMPCIFCESRKTAPYRGCKCTASQAHMVRKIEDITNKRMFDPEGTSLQKLELNVAEDKTYKDLHQEIKEEFQATGSTAQEYGKTWTAHVDEKVADYAS